MENSKYEEAEELINEINNSLANSKTRNFGLELLQNLIPYLSNEIFMENILHWTSYCIIQHKEDVFKELKLNTLAMIIANSHNLELFNKKFLTEYLSVTFRACLVYQSNEEHVAALNCLMQCMKKYPNWFSNYKQKIESFLIECLDSSCELVTKTAASTFVRFLETGSAGHNGIIYVTNFDNGFKKTCITIQKLYNNFLNEISGEYNFVKIDEDALEFKELPYDIPSSNNLVITANRIISCLIFMKSLIVGKFSVEKRIKTKHLLDVICRGLSVHICSSASAILNSTSEHSILLKKIQLHLLSILRASIKRFCTTLIPFSVVIENIILNILRRRDKCNCFVLDLSFKASVYKSLNLWLSTSRTINNELQFQEKLIRIILKDVVSPRRSILLHLKNSDKTNTGNCSWILMNKEIMCIHALDVLKCLLISSFSVDQNLLKEVLVFLIGRLNNPRVDEVGPTYNHTFYQVKLYELLISLIKTEHSAILPSFHFIVNLFNKGLINQHWKISQISETGLDLLEKISQPLCPSLQVCNIPSPLQATYLNNSLGNQSETLQGGSKNNCNKEINILSNIVINTLNDAMNLDTENDVFINTEITQHTEETNPKDDPTLSNFEEGVKDDVDINPEVNTDSDVATENMFCSFQDVIQE